jgi:acetyl-CoA C-acetyltransferase
MPESMPQAMIVATARTPIGRANKGSLVDCRPDDLSATIVQAVLDKVPALDPGEVEDILWGCAQPAGEAGYNHARVVGILAGLPQAGGVTVNRYCSSSLQTIRMATPRIRSGEGDIFVAGGSENVSRFAGGISDGAPGSHNDAVPEDAGHARQERLGRRHYGRRPLAFPTCTSPWARRQGTSPSTST